MTQLEHGERIRGWNGAGMTIIDWGASGVLGLPFLRLLVVRCSQVRAYCCIFVNYALLNLSSEPSLTDAFKGLHRPRGRGGTEKGSFASPSRANRVRFDESAIHGYYGQNRSSSELPLRTGSGMDSHTLTEGSLSHRSDGRLSSSGHSHHSARTNSLGLEGSKLIPSASGSPSNITALPGLFLLGPLPCIIRCWLTTSFSNICGRLLGLVFILSWVSFG